MNEETISQEQYLFNQLNFEERKNIIEIMEYVINLQQQNTQLKDKTEKATKFIERVYDSLENVDKPIFFFEEILKILKGEENNNLSNSK